MFYLLNYKSEMKENAVLCRIKILKSIFVEKISNKKKMGKLTVINKGHVIYEWWKSENIKTIFKEKAVEIFKNTKEDISETVGFLPIAVLATSELFLTILAAIEFAK